MVEDLTNWQALLSSEENGQTEDFSDIFVSPVMVDDWSNSQAFLSSKKNRQTERF